MVRLSKKAIILFIVLGVVVLGATGYLFWRANQAEDLGPEYIAADSPPPDKASCTGCRSNGREWYWVNGQCSDRGSDACKLKNQPPTQKKCSGMGAAGCTGKNPGSACGNGGECIVQEESSMTCRCGGEAVVTKPPTTVTNSCDGGTIGDVSTPVISKVGVPTSISGTAKDSDGIDLSSITVSIDGVEAGKATGTSTDGNKNVNWTFSFTPTAETHKVVVSWKDSKGVGGNACTKQTTITSSPANVTNADWSISVVGGGSGGEGLMCEKSGGQAVSAKADYVVKVSNVGDAVGTISGVSVEVDGSLSSDSIIPENITPSANISGSSITWTLTGEDAVYAIGESKEYKFSLRIPKSLYGVIQNKVTVTPVGAQEPVIKSFDSNILCTDDGKIPETALFDSAVGQIIAAFILILLGLMYIKGYDRSFMEMLDGGYKGWSIFYKKNFGENVRVKKARNKFEKKLK